MAQPVFRFAPSPNGKLHLGHALSAITGHEMARAHGGRFLVRIEDIDTARSRQSYIDGILADLAWLGLDWEQPVLRQSSRFEFYRAAAATLTSQGLLYPCFVNRSEVTALATTWALARDPDGAPILPERYRRRFEADAARRIAGGEPYALRLDMPKAVTAANALLGGRPLTYAEIKPSGEHQTRLADPGCWGDAVIVRKDTPASYHLAVVVDDAAQGVTHVTRGKDLEPATGIHRLLQVLLGLPEPLYHHHRLILGPDGSKLSKSAGDRSLGDLRADGVTPSAIWALVAPAPPPAGSPR